jgi:DNA ligase 3
VVFVKGRRQHRVNAWCVVTQDAMKKCPNGMFAEIKYDGERVQIHKQGSDFKFFSRNLKPVKDDKIAEVRPFVTKALPSADSVILDSEVLLVDKQGNLLKFGTIGVHKRQAFKDASVCLFVFDILYYNGASCLDMGMEERRKLLCDIVKPIQGHVELSVNKEVTDADVLAALMGHVIDRGLEGMVLKDKKSKYLPGKRKWLKIKRDYLSMADTADLVIVGGYYGTGTKGGKISGFLGAVYDERNKVWKTVCKVSTGLDIPTLDRINRDVKV